VKADHGAESSFIFGGPFLMDESSLLGKHGQTDMLCSKGPGWACRNRGLQSALRSLGCPPGPT
jgi:hypothetical protein